MGTGRAPFAELHDVLRRTRHLLLDFDGPVCSLFAGSPEVAHGGERLRNVITRQGVSLPPGLADSNDWFAILGYAASVNAELASSVEQELTNLEISALPTARPNAYAHDVITAAIASGRSVAIVSNNAEQVVRAYLETHDLDCQVRVIAARLGPDPSRLKPSPYLIEQAARELGVAPGDCVIVGDEIKDIRAAQAAGAGAIGYDRDGTAAQRLTHAGACAVIRSMAELTLVLRGLTG